MSSAPPEQSGLGTLAAALDLGTSRAVCWIAERSSAEGDDDGDGVRVLAAGEVPSEGVRAGEVVDVRAAAGSIVAAVEEAEAQSGLSVEGLAVALAGSGVTGTPRHAAIPVTREGQEITRAEARLVIERAGNLPLLPGTVKLQVLPRSFAVDGAGPMRDPVGLTGAILEAEVLIVSGSAFAAENLARAVRLAGRHLASVVAAPAAMGLAVLSPEERELGAVALDMGAGLTDYAAWKDGELRACGCVPVGGELATRDIAVGLGVAREVAEGLKREAAYAFAEELEGEAASRTLQAPSLGGGEPRSFTRGQLSEIVEARVEEILLLVERRLEGMDPARDFGAGVVLAGGGARLAGIERKCAAVLRAPARIARPELATDLPRDLSGPENALGAGLVRWSLEGAVRHEAGRDRRRACWFANAVRWLAAGF